MGLKTPFSKRQWTKMGKRWGGRHSDPGDLMLSCACWVILGKSLALSEPQVWIKRVQPLRGLEHLMQGTVFSIMGTVMANSSRIKSSTAASEQRRSACGQQYQNKRCSEPWRGAGHMETGQRRQFHAGTLKRQSVEVQMCKE